MGLVKVKTLPLSLAHRGYGESLGLKHGAPSGLSGNTGQRFVACAEHAEKPRVLDWRCPLWFSQN